MSQSVRSLLLFVLAIVPVCGLVFLGVSDFFSGWYGTAVSVRPATSEEPRALRVLIVEPTGDTLVRSWPTSIVRKLELPTDAYGIVPVEPDPAKPKTRKDRFTLSYTIEPADGEPIRRATTSPSSFGVTVLVFVLGVFLRNMIASGSPFSLEGGGVVLPKAQAPSGQPVPGRGSRPRKGPPPSGRRKGRGRR